MAVYESFAGKLVQQGFGNLQKSSKVQLNHSRECGYRQFRGLRRGGSSDLRAAPAAGQAEGLYAGV